MTPTETLPLLIVAILLLSASGAQPEKMEVVFDGDHTAKEIEDALVVGGGTVTVPSNATAAGQLYVIGGDVRIDGRVEGDVHLLAGNLTVTDGAVVTGELQTVTGNRSVASGASVGSQSSLVTTQQTRSPFATAGFLAVRTLALVVVGAVLSRRRPTLVHNVADSITEHSVVSGVVGSIAGVTLLVLFVYMAFTLILIPISVLGLFVEFLMVVYSYAVYGFLLGQQLPIERVDVASGVGAGLFGLGLELVGRVPYVGVGVQFLFVVVGLGAILITYFGLREFEPVQIPE
ncbi:polymer-forming cytoskeletal protein [Haladaptatus sp. NG-WS-4]